MSLFRKPAVQSASLTHVGRVRDHNEDACGAFDELQLWLVTDGLGGHAAGEVASALAMEAIPAAMREGQTLEAAIETAHCRISEAPAQGQGRPGMGCTVVALQLDGPHYRIAWVGDSRVYRWDGALHQETKDHSYVQRLIDASVITPEEARRHPQRNMITQALGGLDLGDLKVDSVMGPRNPGDLFLLCSDGLTGEVTDNQIAELLTEPRSLQEKADALVQAVLDQGGSDNITVVLVEILN